MEELNEKIQRLHLACKTLAGVCDGAIEQDGQGFNKPDSWQGHLMAYRSEWNVAEARDMCKMLQKYVGQLESYRIDISDIKPKDFPSVEIETPKFLIDLGTKDEKPVFHVHFPHSPETVKLMKQNGGIYGAKFYNDPYSRFWCFEPKTWREVKLLQQNEGFVLTPKAEIYLEDLLSGRQTPPPEAIEENTTRVVNSPEAEAEAEVETVPVIEKKPANRIENVNGVFVIYFPFSYDQLAGVKNILGRKFNPNDYDEKVWTVTPNATNYHLIDEYITNFGVSVDESVKSIISSYQTVTTQNFEDSRAEDAEINLNYGVDLFPFQRAGVKYAIRSKRCFIADEMGLGKTHQATATVNEVVALPCLIICPASLKFNWKKEIKKGCGKDTKVSVWSGSGGDATADFIVINYDLLSKFEKQLCNINFKSVVADESHYLKNAKAKRTISAIEIAQSIEYRYALTGTPVLSRPIELLSQLNFLGRLEDFGGFWNFVSRYCNAHKIKIGKKSVWDFTGASNLKELNDNLRKTCFIRRKKMDVLKEMPSKLRAEVTLEIDNREEYKKAEADVFAFLDFFSKVQERALSDEKFLETISKLSPAEQEMAKAERVNDAQISAQKAEAIVQINTLKKLAAKGKLQSSIEWIETFLESGEKLVVFCEHIELQKSLQQHFNALHVFGEDSAEERQKNVEAFQTNKSRNLIVCSLQAAGVGITLTESSNVAFIEQGWTPALMLQAADRVHRIGQTKPCTIWYLLAQNTIDEYIAEVLDNKMKICDAAVDGDEKVAKSSILPELLKLIKSEK